MIQLILLYGLLFGSDKISDNEIPGTYVRRVQKHSNVRQFGRSLTLNCDSTVVARFWGDMENETVRGRWTIKEDTLRVLIDEPVGHWRAINLFLVQKKKLFNIVTDINGQKIRDEKVLEIMHKESKKYAYDRTKKQDCE